MTGLADRPWWTAADAAELDALTFELVDGVLEHRAACAVCIAGFPPCPHVHRAIDVVLAWRQRAILRSRARYLRLEEELRHVQVERARLREAHEREEVTA